MIIIVLHGQKLKKVQPPAWGQTAVRKQRQEPNPSLLTPDPVLLYLRGEH